MSKLNWFKADTPDDRSQDILVSFSSRWNDLLRNGSINLVFRRRYPKTLGAKRMFIYVGSPYSEIIGFSIIKDIKPMTFTEGIRLLDKAQITKPELEMYFQGYSSVGGYRVSKITLFDSPVSLQTLRGESGFSPPQSFVFLSKRASIWLDQQPHTGQGPHCRKRD